MMLEVCVESPEAAERAWRAGATRIELSSALALGGVTPSHGLVEATLELIQCPLIVLVRCRLGGFVYSDAEKKTMLREVEHLSRFPLAGIAVGALDPHGDLDWSFLEQVTKTTDVAELVVHRAFDQVAGDVFQLDRLVELGYRRVLTSGGPLTAVEGIASLRGLQAHAQGRIEILPAGGVRLANASRILDETKCTQLHGSFGLRTGQSDSRWGHVADVDTDEIHHVANLMRQRHKA
jgi:copper homeostasis protein